MPELAMLPSPPNGPFTADYEVEGFVARTLRGGEYRTSPTDRVRMTLRYGIILHGNAGNFMRQMEELRDQDILIPDWTQERSVLQHATLGTSIQRVPQKTLGDWGIRIGLDERVGRLWDSSEGYMLRWNEGDYLILPSIHVDHPLTPQTKTVEFAVPDPEPADLVSQLADASNGNPTVTPLRRGRLRRLPQVVVVKSDLVQAEIEFVADVERQEHYAVRWTPPHFNGVPYLSLPPDMRSSPIRTFEDFVELKEYGFGDADRTTEAKVTARQWDLPFRLDAAETSELISIFGACRGRFGSLWLPSWTEDWQIRNIGTDPSKYFIDLEGSEYRNRWSETTINSPERERLEWLALQLPNASELLPVKVDRLHQSQPSVASKVLLQVPRTPTTNASTILNANTGTTNSSAFSLNRARFGQDRIRLTFDSQGLCHGNVRFVELPFEYNQPQRQRTAVKTVSFGGTTEGTNEPKDTILPDVECESFIARNTGSVSARINAKGLDDTDEPTQSITLEDGQETRIYAQSPAEYEVDQPSGSAGGTLSLIIDTPDQDRPAWLYEFFEETSDAERLREPLYLTSYWRDYQGDRLWRKANIEHGDIEKNTTLDASEIDIMLVQKLDDFDNDNRTNILWDIVERELHPVNLRFQLWEMPIRGLPRRLVFDGTVITVGREGVDTLKISARDYFDFSNKRVGRTRLSVRCSAALFDQDCGVGWARNASPNRFQLDPGATAPSITETDLTLPRTSLLPFRSHDPAYAWRFKIYKYGDGNGLVTKRGNLVGGKYSLVTEEERFPEFEYKGIPYVVGRFLNEGNTESNDYPTKAKVEDGPRESVASADTEFFVNGSIIFSKQRRTIFKINKKSVSTYHHFQVLINIQFANIDTILEKQTLETEDYAVITAGCDKSWVTCHSRFQNTPRFRGAPRIPPKNPIITSLSEPAQPSSGKKGASGTC